MSEDETVRMILMVTWKRWRWTGGRIEERWTAIVMKRTVVTITVSDKDLNNSDENLNREEEMERDVPPIPPYSMTSGCSATLAGNAPIDYFSLFVDDYAAAHS